VKDWNTIYEESESQKQAGIAKLISDKIENKSEEIKRVTVKKTIHQENIKVLTNIDAPNFIQQILLHIKEPVTSDTIIAGNFNTTLSSLDR
jgi:hypothetical protein